MVGFAISVYDKFDELAVLVDIIRENWEDEYHISVCCNHPEGQDRIEELGLDIDEYVEGSDIVFDPDFDYVRRDINKRSRILESIKKSNLSAIDAGCDYVMHLHADAWPLSEESFQDIKDEMEENGSKVAFRGHGLEWRTPSCYTGQVMDQFFLYDTEFAREARLFDYEPLELLPHKSIHNSLALLLFGRAGLSNLYWYSDMKDDIQWDGEPVDLPFTGVRPGVFNPVYDLLHIASDEFPQDLGKSIQALYLKEQSLSGEYIDQFIDDHYRENVIKQVHEIEEEYNRRLRLLGFKPRVFGREFTDMEEVLAKPTSERLKLLFVKRAKNIVKWGMSTFLSQIPRFSKLSDRSLWRFHRDAGWPDTKAEDVYLENVEKIDFPNNDFWFDKNGS